MSDVTRESGRYTWVYDAPVDKCRKPDTGGRLTSSTSASRGRQALVPVNSQKEVSIPSSEAEAPKCEVVEFTMENVNALLNEGFKGKQFDPKGKQEWHTEYIRRLKVCIKWFQKGLQDLDEEKNNLREMLDSSERKCVETEAAMKSKEEELNATISELKTIVSSLEESLAKEESEKLFASRGRQALVPVNSQKEVSVPPSEAEAPNSEVVEFTMADVDALLNERFEGKLFDSKGKQEWHTEYIRRLKVCIKWLQKSLQDLAECEMLDSLERKCVETEVAMKSKEEELGRVDQNALNSNEKVTAHDLSSYSKIYSCSAFEDTHDANKRLGGSEEVIPIADVSGSFDFTEAKDIRESVKASLLEFGGDKYGAENGDEVETELGEGKVHGNDEANEQSSSGGLRSQIAGASRSDKTKERRSKEQIQSDLQAINISLVLEYLNTVDNEELSKIPMLGQVTYSRARDQRPFKTIEEVRYHLFSSQTKFDAFMEKAMAYIFHPKEKNSSKSIKLNEELG